MRLPVSEEPVPLERGDRDSELPAESGRDVAGSEEVWPALKGCLDTAIDDEVDKGMGGAAMSEEPDATECVGKL